MNISSGKSESDVQTVHYVLVMVMTSSSIAFDYDLSMVQPTIDSIASYCPSPDKNNSVYIAGFDGRTSK